MAKKCGVAVGIWAPLNVEVKSEADGRAGCRVASTFNDDHSRIQFLWKTHKKRDLF